MIKICELEKDLTDVRDEDLGAIVGGSFASDLGVVSWNSSSSYLNPKGLGSTMSPDKTQQNSSNGVLSFGANNKDGYINGNVNYANDFGWRGGIAVDHGITTVGGQAPVTPGLSLGGSVNSLNQFTVEGTLRL